MTASEVSIKGNCVNGRGGESFSSGCSEPNDARNTIEGQNGHSTRTAAVRGITFRASVSGFPLTIFVDLVFSISGGIFK